MSLDPKVYQELLDIFQVELKEQQQIIIDGLLALETMKDSEQLDHIIQNIFRASHNIKGAAKSVSLDIIAGIAHHLEDLFSLWRQNKSIPTSQQINACLKVADNLLLAMQAHLNKQNDVALEEYLAPLLHDEESNSSTIAEKIVGSDNSEVTLKVSAKKVERANTRADELLLYQLKLENLLQLISHQSEMGEQIYLSANNANKQLPNCNDANIQELTTLFADIITKADHINQSFLALKRELTTLHSEYATSLHELQNSLREMRLIPIAKILDPLKRHARDLAVSLHKKVNVVIEGGDIELDKSVLELIKDPLQHLIRNAIDHGIELPDVRKQAGKEEIGTIKIHVAQEGGKIQIGFSDDGCGIDVDTVKKIALHNKLIDPLIIDKLNEQQLLEIIFLPGFSTQQQVTEISGRGVGLDIVHSNIEAVKGRITVESKTQFGTQFTLVLPLTLATTKALYINTGEQQFAIPSAAISNISEVKVSDIKAVEADHIYILNQEPIPVRKLSSLLGIKEKPSTKKHNCFGFILKRGARKVFVLVDNIINEYECLIKPLPYPITSHKNISGTTLTAQGHLILVLNPSDIVNAAFNIAPQHITYNEEKAQDQKQRILVVDDSITTRNLEVNSLSAAGYDVTGAASGNEALEKMKTNDFNLIITDIEMPNIDGYEFTRIIRASEKHKHIPIVIVSSHESETEKNRGLEAGANVYLVKSQFNTKVLIELIDSLL